MFHSKPSWKSGETFPPAPRITELAVKGSLQELSVSKRYVSCPRATPMIAQKPGSSPSRSTGRRPRCWAAAAPPRGRRRVINASVRRVPRIGDLQVRLALQGLRRAIAILGPRQPWRRKLLFCHVLHVKPWPTSSSPCHHVRTAPIALALP